MNALTPTHGPLASRQAFAAYGLLGLPLAFVALPVYVHLPNVYAQQHGVPLAALGGVLLFSRSVDAVVDPWLGRWGDALYRHSWRAVWLAAVLLALPALWGWALTTALLVLMLALGLFTWQRLAKSAASSNVSVAPTQVAGSLWQPWKYAGFRRLLMVFMLNGLASAVPATLVLFFVQDLLQAPKAMEPLFLGLYFAAGALSFPLWLQVIDRIGLLRTWASGMALSVLAFVSVVTLSAGDTIGFFGVCALSGMALGADLTVPGALLNQLIDRCGERGRTDGAFMGWWNLATKLNLALAAGLSLPLLGLWGYAPGQHDANAVLALGLAYGVLPCVLKLLAGWALYWGLMRQPDLISGPAKVHPPA